MDFLTSGNPPASELLDGLRSGNIVIRPTKDVLPLNYSPEVTLRPEPNLHDGRWSHLNLEFIRNDLLLFSLRISGHAFLKGQDLDYDLRPACTEFPGGFERAVPRVVPSEGGSRILFFDSYIDIDSGHVSCKVDVDCDPETLPAICAEIQALIADAMPGFEVPSEAGALRWMKKAGFSRDVYNRFCSMTGASLLQGLLDGSICIECDPPLFPIEYGECSPCDAETFVISMLVRRGDDILTDLDLWGWGCWRPGEEPGDPGELSLSYENCGDQILPRVMPSKCGGMTFIYSADVENIENPPQGESSHALQLPAGCPQSEIETLCTALQRVFDQAVPGFTDRCDADELQWLVRNGTDAPIGLGEDGELREGADCYDGLHVKAIRGRSHGRMIYGVDDVDRLFLCPKEAGRAAKEQLVSKLRRGIDRIEATEFVVPDDRWSGR